MKNHQDCRAIILLILAFLLSFVNSQERNPFLLHDKKAKGFGISVLFEKKNLEHIPAFFKHYSKGCSALIEEINIILSSQVKELSGNLEIPTDLKVNYYRFEKYSPNNRFQLPNSSHSHIILILDPDTRLSCQTIEKGFKLYQENAKLHGSSVAPIVGFRRSGYGFQSRQVPPSSFLDQFSYYDPIPQESRFFSMASLKAMFLAKAYLNLYFLPVPEFVNIRHHIEETQYDCQDVALWFIISQIYPQLLPPIFVDLNQSQDHIGNWTEATIQRRSNCLKVFTDMLGWNPIKVFDLDLKNFYKTWRNPKLVNIIRAKSAIIADALYNGKTIWNASQPAIDQALEILKGPPIKEDDQQQNQSGLSSRSAKDLQTEMLVNELNSFVSKLNQTKTAIKQNVGRSVSATWNILNIIIIIEATVFLIGFWFVCKVKKNNKKISLPLPNIDEQAQTEESR